MNLSKPWKYSSKDALTVNRLAREQFKKRMLAEILADMNICRLEGTDPFEYVEELYQELARIRRMKYEQH